MIKHFFIKYYTYFKIYRTNIIDMKDKRKDIKSKKDNNIMSLKSGCTTTVNNSAILLELLNALINLCRIF